MIAVGQASLGGGQDGPRRMAPTVRVRSSNRVVTEEHPEAELNGLAEGIGVRPVGVLTGPNSTIT